MLVVFDELAFVRKYTKWLLIEAMLFARSDGWDETQPLTVYHQNGTAMAGYIPNKQKESINGKEESR